MKRLIWFIIVGALIGFILLTLVQSPFVIVGYFGIYLIGTITVFQYYFDELRPHEMKQETIIPHQEY